MPAARFSAALVTYHSDPAVLARALASLGAAILRARAEGAMAEATVYLVENDPGEADPYAGAREAFPAAAGALVRIHGQGNVGYGRANNLAIERAGGDVHLVMNPDVELAPDALLAALRALEAHPRVGLVAPSVTGPDGAAQFLCKRYPSVWVLFLRSFAPAALRRRFASTLDRYEMRDVIGDTYVEGIPLASGCFIVARTALLRRIGGFDPGYFMYFEDYDLTLRAAREAQVAYVPEARIVHLGGHSSRKGWRHVAWFVRSAWRFFSRHGWKIA
jgi:GT2 family glycosyltransferase